MLSVYQYMAGGLGLTGLASYFVAANPAIFSALFSTSLHWVILLAPIAIVLFLSFRIQQMSAQTAQITFWVFAAVMGISLAPIFLVYAQESIARAFFITAGMFGAMSLYGYTTKRDLTAFGSFLFMGLIGIIIASIVNIWVGGSGLSFAISVISVFIFTGLVAFDTQRIKGIYYAGDIGEVTSKKAIFGALQLYLDFINLFLNLLRIMGDRR
jgi:FtsH-binding integral membrane protein